MGGPEEGDLRCDYVGSHNIVIVIEVRDWM